MHSWFEWYQKDHLDRWVRRRHPGGEERRRRRCGQGGVEGCWRRSGRWNRRRKAEEKPLWLLLRQLKCVTLRGKRTQNVNGQASAAHTGRCQAQAQAQKQIRRNANASVSGGGAHCFRSKYNKIINNDNLKNVRKRVISCVVRPVLLCGDAEVSLLSVSCY